MLCRGLPPWAPTVPRGLPVTGACVVLGAVESWALPKASAVAAHLLSCFLLTRQGLHERESACIHVRSRQSMEGASCQTVEVHWELFPCSVWGFPDGDDPAWYLVCAKGGTRSSLISTEPRQEPLSGGTQSPWKGGVMSQG